MLNFKKYAEWWRLRIYRDDLDDEIRMTYLNEWSFEPEFMENQMLWNWSSLPRRRWFPAWINQHRVVSPPMQIGNVLRFGLVPEKSMLLRGFRKLYEMITLRSFSGLHFASFCRDSTGRRDWAEAFSPLKIPLESNVRASPGICGGRISLG